MPGFLFDRPVLSLVSHGTTVPWSAVENKSEHLFKFTIIDGAVICVIAILVLSKGSMYSISDYL